MARKDSRDLRRFLKPFPDDVNERAMWLRDFVWELYPKTNELIYDNYNAVAFGWSHTDRVSHVFCNVAVGRTSYNVQFGFYYGAKLSDPKKILLGEGNQYRYLLVKDIKDFPQGYVKKLLREAHAFSLAKVKDKAQLRQGETITKSISAIKRTKAGKRK